MRKVSRIYCGNSSIIILHSRLISHLFLNSHQQPYFVRKMPSVERRTPKTGDAIEVFWPDDNEWYGGTVGLFFRPTGRFAVNYDDEDREVLDLKKERWRFKGDQSERPNGKTQQPSPSNKVTKKSPSRIQKKRTPTKNKSSSVSKPKTKANTTATTADNDNARPKSKEASPARAPAAKQQSTPKSKQSADKTPPSAPTNTKTAAAAPVPAPAPAPAPAPTPAPIRAAPAPTPAPVPAAAAPPVPPSLPWQSLPAVQQPPIVTPTPKSPVTGYVSEETLSAGGPSDAGTPPRRPPLKLKLPLTKKRVRRPTPSPTEVSVAEALASLEVQMRRTDELLPQLNTTRKPIVAHDASEKIESVFQNETTTADNRYERMSSVLDAVKVRTMVPNHDLLSVLRDARAQIIHAFQQARVRQ